MCRYKLRAQEPLSASGDGRRFHLGVFIGIDRRKGQYMIHTGTEVKYARTILRLPEVDKWNQKELAKVAATPWELHKPKNLEVVFQR